MGKNIKMFGEGTKYSYENVSEITQNAPISFTAYRVFYILDDDARKLNAEDEIPFIKSPIYPLFLLAYLLLKRTNWVIRDILGRRPPKLRGHVFVVTTAASYRFYPLLLVAQRMSGAISVLCTVPAHRRLEREGLGNSSWNVVQFNRLLGAAPFREFLSCLPEAWRITRRMGDRLETTSLRKRSIVFNLVLTEFAKSSNFAAMGSEIETCHFQAPSPYILGNVSGDGLYFYQHGQEISMTARVPAMGTTATYLSWGPGWDPEQFCPEHVLEVVTFVPAGNPFYDQLLERREERPEEPAMDVLFLSNSHVISEADRVAYRSIVQHLIDFCDREGYELGVKLHRPQEDASFYEANGWSDYVVDLDIKEAILNSRVTVADASSGFLESVVLGTPAILTQQLNQIKDQTLPRRIPGVYLPEGINDLDCVLEEALQRRLTVEELNGCGVFRLGGSAERIARHIENNR